MRGDFQRIDNQQAFLRALMTKAASGDTLKNPLALDRLLSVATRSMTVDRGFQVKETAFALRGLRPDDLTFMTVPFAGYDKIRGQSVVILDDPKADALFAAVRTDSLGAYVAANPPRKQG